jgi:hypothetical protein
VSNVNCSAIDAKTMLIAKQNNVNYYQFAEQNDVKQCELLSKTVAISIGDNQEI